MSDFDKKVESALLEYIVKKETLDTAEYVRDLEATIAAQAKTIRELEALAVERYRAIAAQAEQVRHLDEAVKSRDHHASTVYINSVQIERLTAERDALREQLRKHDEWFSNNAANLAVHRIGGFSFDGPPLPNEKP